MQKRIRKPRRKKTRFAFKTKSGRIIVHDSASGFYMKQVFDIVYKGDFGYHHAHTSWTVFHIPTGLDVCYCEKESDARISVKKLFAKVFSENWENIDAFKCVFELQVLVNQITYILKRGTVPFKYRDFVANPDEDIPF